MANCDCCGCVIESDYGTSIVTGKGTRLDPYIISIVDTAWVRPAARVRNTTGQTISVSGTASVVSFDSEIFDTGNFWSAAAPTLIKIPETGIYIFGASGIWAANGTGTRELSFRKNGSLIIQSNDQPVDTATAAVTPYAHITYQTRLDTGDTLELLARQESGGSLAMIAEDNDSIVFWIVYAGKTI